MKIDKNAISKEQIEAWKAEFGHVYRTTLDDGQPIIWRRLKRKEYQDIILETLDEDNEENNTEAARTKRLYLRQNLIASKAIIYPENAMDILEDYIFAVTNISEEIMAKSGFDLPASEEL